MLQKFNLGFTLIELLVAVAIIGVMSVVSVNLLYATVLSRARQTSIQASSEDIRSFISDLSKSIKESKNLKVISPTEIGTIEYKTNPDLTTYHVCKTFRLNGTSIEVAEIQINGCSFPTSGFSIVTGPHTQVSSLVFTQSGLSVDVSVSGQTEDSFGKHDFSYTTTIVKRIE